jgi:tight adherence protein C
VIAVSLLAGLAAVFASAAAWEAFAVRAGGPVGAGGRLRLPGGTRILLAAWKLGLPARLARSGLEARFPIAAVLLAKLAGLAVGGVVAWGAAPAAPGRLSLLVAGAVPVAGFLLPDALLEREARGRRRRLLGALPDALDLLAVGSAAGRSPASGFAEIAGSGEGPLAAELRILVAEVSCGRPLATALRSLRSRVPGNEIAGLCASIERSHRLGSPLAEQLRRQAGALRRTQRRSVEERAARAAPKIQLVVALVLVPSVLLMIAAGLIANADLLLGDF